jgi:hypothetical protein
MEQGLKGLKAPMANFRAFSPFLCNTVLKGFAPIE